MYDGKFEGALYWANIAYDHALVMPNKNYFPITAESH